VSRILPREDLILIKIPDSTPEIISTYAQGDEQALLARVRYNRLVDVFLGITTYSLQNTFEQRSEALADRDRRVVRRVSRSGQQFVIPVQAKAAAINSRDPNSAGRGVLPGEIRQPEVSPRVCQFMADGVIAMFELTMQDGQIRVVDEKHYKLVPSRRLQPRSCRVTARGSDSWTMFLRKSARGSWHQSRAPWQDDEKALSLRLRAAGLLGYRKQWAVLENRLRLAWSEGRRVRGWLLLARMPSLQQAVEKQRQVLAQEGRGQPQTGRPRSTELRRKGWCVLRIWECRVESDAALARIMRVMEERRKS